MRITKLLISFFMFTSDHCFDSTEALNFYSSKIIVHYKSEIDGATTHSKDCNNMNPCLDELIRFNTRFKPLTLENT